MSNLTIHTAERGARTPVTVGLPIRIVEAYPNYGPETVAALVGVTGLIDSDHADNDGDIRVRLNEPLPGIGGRVYYVRAWTVLSDEIGGSFAEQAVEPTDEPTAAERKLERLIDAIYEGARDNGYRGLLPELFANADIPMRPVKQYAYFLGNRVVQLDDYEAGTKALTRHRRNPDDTTVEVDVLRTVVEFRVQVEIGTTTECNCTSLTANYKADPSTLGHDAWQRAALAVGFQAGATLQRVIVEQAVADDRFGVTVACDNCK
jgi:hypothetical protein